MVMRHFNTEAKNICFPYFNQLALSIQQCICAEQNWMPSTINIMHQKILLQCAVCFLCFLPSHLFSFLPSPVTCRFLNHHLSKMLGLYIKLIYLQDTFWQAFSDLTQGLGESGSSFIIHSNQMEELYIALCCLQRSYKIFRLNGGT